MSSSSSDSDKPSPPLTPTTKDTSTWKLPNGIEQHLEAGLLKTAAGVAIGGALGMILFRTGSGYRQASVAAGVGVALGSTMERMAGYQNK